MRDGMRQSMWAHESVGMSDRNLWVNYSMADVVLLWVGKSDTAPIPATPTHQKS